MDKAIGLSAEETAIMHISLHEYNVGFWLYYRCNRKGLSHNQNITAQSIINFEKK